jgi:hypothetical protein
MRALVAAAGLMLALCSQASSDALMCRADQPGPHPELDAAMRERAMLAVPAPSADAHYISAGELLRRQRAGERLHLIDPRPEGLGGSLVMEPAMRLSPTQLKAQTLWRSEPIVLVGSGAAYRAVEALQQALRHDGFSDVSILDGGARAWLAEVERKRPGVAEMLIDADAIDLYGDASRWTIVDLAGDSPALPNQLAHVRVPQTETAAAARAAAGSVPSSRTRPNVLVVAPDDAAGLALAEALSTQVRANVYALRGGWAAQVRHERWMRQMHAGVQGEVGLHAGRACW